MNEIEYMSLEWWIMYMYELTQFMYDGEVKTVHTGDGTEATTETAERLSEEQMASIQGEIQQTWHIIVMMTVERTGI